MQAFEPLLVNGQTGDPGLFVDLLGRKRAFLFDLGKCDNLAAAQVLRITDVFVTHTHIDHFIGFDSLVRWHLSRTSQLRIYGPEPILENVAGRLRGYTWNLVTDQSPVIEAIEVGPDGRATRAQTFRCVDQFAPGPIEERDLPALLDESGLVVTAAVCDHHDRTSVACRLEERTRWHVQPERLAELGLGPGPWVAALKEAAQAGRAASATVDTPDGARPLADFLEHGALYSVPGESLAYVSDVAWHEGNLAKLTALCEAVGLLYCEGGYLAVDASHARRVSHLTAREAGELARRAGAGTLRTFHFSRRYHPDFEPLRAEAAAAFRGEA